MLPGDRKELPGEMIELSKAGTMPHQLVQKAYNLGEYSKYSAFAGRSHRCNPITLKLPWVRLQRGVGRCMKKEGRTDPSLLYSGSKGETEPVKMCAIPVQETLALRLLCSEKHAGRLEDFASEETLGWRKHLRSLSAFSMFCYQDDGSCAGSMLSKPRLLWDFNQSLE